MIAASESLEFERAAKLRDRISAMRDSIGKERGAVEVSDKRGGRGRGRGRGASGRVPRPKR